MNEFALQANLCYNEVSNIVVSEDAVNTFRLVTYLVRRQVTMNTLPPHANNDNSSSIPATSGIYKITCTANKKIYIGSAINLQGRKRQHFHALRQNIHHNPRLQNAWNKYGEQTFIFEVLELVLIPELLIVQEQYWLDKLKPFGKNGFNIVFKAGSNLGMKYTPEAIENLKLSHIGKKQSAELIEKRIAPLRGRKRSPEAIENMRQSHLGKKPLPQTIEAVKQANLGNTYNLGKKRSPEARERMRQAALARKRVKGGFV